MRSPTAAREAPRAEEDPVTNAKLRWQNGEMCLRWTAAGMLEAETQFRRVIGHGDLAKLAIAIERDVASKHAADTLHTPITTAAPKVAASPA